MTEQSTIELLNNLSGTDLKLVSDKYSSYDAEGRDYIVEIKNRRAYYKDKLIEASKLFANYNKSQIKGKLFLYVVTDPKGVYIYNINKNITLIINQPTRAIECPINTDFGNQKKITKISYLLDEGLSIKL